MCPAGSLETGNPTAERPGTGTSILQEGAEFCPAVYTEVCVPGAKLRSELSLSGLKLNEVFLCKVQSVLYFQEKAAPLVEESVDLQQAQRLQ